jgi:hypothetical protein
MRRQKHCRVLGLLRQGQELLAQGVCRLHLGARSIIIPQTTQHREKLVKSFQVFTELSRTCIDLSNFRSRVALRGKQRRAQGNVHIHLLLDAIRCLRERLEQREPVAKVTDGFHMS